MTLVKEKEENIQVRLRKKYVESIQALQAAALQSFKSGIRKGTIEALNHVNLIALQCRELDLFKRTTNVIAYIYYNSKTYSKALHTFKRLRDASHEDLDYM